MHEYMKLKREFDEQMSIRASVLKREDIAIVEYPSPFEVEEESQLSEQ